MKIFFLLVSPVVFFTFSNTAFSWNQYLTEFKKVYPNTNGTQLAKCSLCHVKPGYNNLNSFSDDYVNNDYNYITIEALDSDGDGFTNIEEINLLSLPGDSTSYPNESIMHGNKTEY